jgi:hypothetical protein
MQGHKNKTRKTLVVGSTCEGLGDEHGRGRLDCSLKSEVRGVRYTLNRSDTCLMMSNMYPTQIIIVLLMKYNLR